MHPSKKVSYRKTKKKSHLLSSGANLTEDWINYKLKLGTWKHHPWMPTLEPIGWNWMVTWMVTQCLKVWQISHRFHVHGFVFYVTFHASRGHSVCQIALLLWTQSLRLQHMGISAALVLSLKIPLSHLQRVPSRCNCPWGPEVQHPPQTGLFPSWPSLITPSTSDLLWFLPFSH